MTYESAFDEFLNLTVTVTPYSSRDGWGAASGAGTAFSVGGRIEQDIKLIRDETGREVASRVALYLKPVKTSGEAYTLSKLDKITLPAGFSPQEPPILSVQPHYDETAVLHHYEVRT